MKYIQVIKRGAYVRRYFDSPTGFRVTLPEIDDPSFGVVYGAALERAQRELAERNERRRRRVDAAEGKKETSFYLRMAARMRHRAADLDVPCELTAEGLRAISEAQGNQCALTGIHFVFKTSERGRGSPFAPSPDRIESAKGYVGGNVRMVCQMANYARLDFSDAEFYRMCQAASEWHKKRLRNAASKPVCKLP